MKEHGGHLAHLNPLHNVKVVHVAPRPLCNAQSRVKRRTGHSPLHQEKTLNLQDISISSFLILDFKPLGKAPQMSLPLLK